MTIHFNPAAFRAILKSSEVRAMVKEKADEIAAHIDQQGILVGAFKGGVGEIPLPVEVRTNTTDRATASVVLAHPAGIAVQAKYGALTRAASAEGLSVKGD